MNEWVSYDVTDKNGHTTYYPNGPRIDIIVDAKNIHFMIMRFKQSGA